VTVFVGDSGTKGTVFVGGRQRGQCSLERDNGEETTGTVFCSIAETFQEKKGFIKLYHLSDSKGKTIISPKNQIPRLQGIRD